MLVLLSPSKTLDDSQAVTQASVPRLEREARTLSGALKKLKRADLQDLMSVSEKLADLNYRRNQERSFPHTEENAVNALRAFKGDVYLDIGIEDWTEEQFALADRRIRILSGLYGLLRPTDLIQPYRLEMGTRLKTRRGNDLYDYWGDRITKLLRQDLREAESEVVINLASKEYFRSIQPETLGCRIINVDFKEDRDGKLRFITYNAKRARGKMAGLVVEEDITDPEQLKGLSVNDYVYRDDLSGDDDWVFVR